MATVARNVLNVSVDDFVHHRKGQDEVTTVYVDGGVGTISGDCYRPEELRRAGPEKLVAVNCGHTCCQKKKHED